MISYALDDADGVMECCHLILPSMISSVTSDFMNYNGAPSYSPFF